MVTTKASAVAAQGKQAPAQSALTRAVSKCLLFSCGPFFCYPWKPIVNEIQGVEYTVANKHFWQQHKDTWNLLWHVVCLFFQLWSNFAFLSAAEPLLLQWLGGQKFGLSSALFSKLLEMRYLCLSSAGTPLLSHLI
jgi:hypothetical protein